MTNPSTPLPEQGEAMSKLLSDEELREKLAAIEHQRWADWQKWCHKVLRENYPSPELEKVLERWDRQIATPYSELSENEKDSDREQVDRYWSLIDSYHQQKLERAVREARLNERIGVALDNYRGQTFSESTNYEAKFSKFIRNNEAVIKRLSQIYKICGSLKHTTRKCPHK